MPESALILDRYRVLGRAGAGGYATVLHAFDTHLKRDVAIKCIQLNQGEGARVPVIAGAGQSPSRMLPLRGEERRDRKRLYGRNRQQADEAGMRTLVDSNYAPEDNLPIEPGFLSKREKRVEEAQARSEARRAQRYSGRAADGRGAASVRSRASMHDAEDVEIPSFLTTDRTAEDANMMELASSLPGRIAGAGEMQISAVGDEAVDLGEEFAEAYEEELEAEPAEGFGKTNPIVPGNTMAFSRSKRESAMGPRRNNLNSALRTTAHVVQPPKAQKRRARSEYRLQSFSEDIPVPNMEILHAEVDPASIVVPGLEEARTAAHLNDANIVTVYDCIVEAQTCYVIMEYVEGKTLASLMREIGNDITLDMIGSVFTSVSHALEVAHQANVLHLDIKPENVIVNREGVVKVTDFGLSALMDAGGKGSTGGGTIGYMPLEQMRQKALDVRTDEWSLASMTYEMLSGTNPFRAKSLDTAERAIENAELILPSACWDAIDPDIDDVMFQAMDPYPDMRFDNVKQFADRLTPMLGSPKEGKKQLAKVVRNEMQAPAAREEPKKREKREPLIDRLGPDGANIVVRVIAVLGALMMGVIALMNLRIVIGGGDAYPDTTFGLFSTMPPVAWVLLAASAGLTGFRPRWGIVSSLGLFLLMLLFNQAWGSAAIFALGLGAWWWLIGRFSDTACSVLFLQPLFGSVGFAPIAPVLAGTMMDVRESAATAAACAVSAIVFASLGSVSLQNWEVYSNFIVAVNPSIAGASITTGLMATLSSVGAWAQALSWVLGAFAISFFCRRGTRTFDVLGAVVCAALLLAGYVLFVVLGDPLSVSALGIFGALIPGILGIVGAYSGVCDRVRMVEGEW